MRALPTIIVCVVASVCANAHAAPQSLLQQRQLDSILKRLHTAHAEYAATLTEFSAQFDQLGQAETAAELRRLKQPLDPNTLRAHKLPDRARARISTSLPPAERMLRLQVWKTRERYAASLYLLSRRALRDGLASLSFRLLHETAEADPDHAMARKLLGWKRNGDEWITPFAFEQHKKRMVWHEKFGWLPRGHVKRYEDGERFFQRRWMSAEKEAVHRQDFQFAWEVRTEHFLVKTNHSLERGVEVATELETFHDFFIQAFAGFFNTKEQLQKLFTPGGRRPQSRDPYEVHYYRTRAEYVRRLKPKIPQVEITNGLYHNGDRVSYFYFDPQQDNTNTLYHEASHQLMYESSNRNRDVGGDAHFWIVEGIACYVESFENQGGVVSIGDPGYIRFQAARKRYLDDRYYVPFRQFDSMGMRAFQTDQNIRPNYSQASGLAHFFMHFDNGRYREALMQHLSQLYNPKPRQHTQSMQELTGVTAAEFDRQYAGFLQQLSQGVGTVEE